MVNTNIPFGFQRPRFDQGEGQRNALAIRGAQMQEAANAFNLQGQMQEVQRRNALMGAMGNIDITKPEGIQQAAQVSASFGDTAGAQKWLKEFREMEGGKLAREKADIEFVNRVAPGLMRPETYAQARDLIMKRNPDMALPEEYDPQAAEFIINQVQGVKGILDRDLAERQLVQSGVGKTTPLPPEVAAQQRDIRSAGATNIQVNTAPKLPPNFMWANPDDPSQGVVPIPGGPQDLEAQAAEEQEAGRQAQRARAGGTVIQDLQRGLDIVQTNKSATGAPALITRYLPESDGQALSGFVESALSNVGLDTLQAMRENSPTGGALGQVPIQQQKRLEQVLGSLNITQRREIVEDNLKRVINIYKDIVYGTPEEIARLQRENLIDADSAKDYAERYELTFDEMGRKRPNTKMPNKKPEIKFLGFE